MKNEDFPNRRTLPLNKRELYALQGLLKFYPRPLPFHGAVTAPGCGMDDDLYVGLTYLEMRGWVRVPFRKRWGAPPCWSLTGRYWTEYAPRWWHKLKMPAALSEKPGSAD